MIDPSNDSHATGESDNRPTRRRLLLKGLLALIGLTLAAGAYLWFGVPPKVPTSPIHLVRMGDGPLSPAKAEEEPRGVRFEAQTCKLESQNTLSSSAASSESQPARFACARIAIFNRSDHLLMARFGGRLLEQLKPLGYIQQVDYYPAGFTAAEGQLAPDLAITLELAKLTENRGLLASTVAATILVRAGNGAPDCRNSHFDGLTPPLIQFDWSGRLEHRSTTTGVASSAARYQLVADDIAKQIVAALTKELGDRRQKHGALPELPADFYPAYRPSVTLPWDASGEPEQVWSWHGLMNHNETLWRISADGPPADLIAQWQKRLGESGWEGGDLSGDATSPFLRVRQHDIVLQIYPATGTNSQQNDASSRTLIYVHYLDRLTQSELEAAIDRALDRGAGNDMLVLFERHWSAAQQQQVLKKFQASQARTPQAALTLANLYHRLRRDTEAKEELLRAQILLRTVDNPGDLEGQLRALAKQLGDEKLLELPIDSQRLLDLGFQELTPGKPVAPQEVGIDQPILFWLKQVPPAEGLRTISLRVVKPDSAASSAIGLAHVESTQNGRSWGAGGPEYACGIGDAGTFCFRLQSLASAERFRITAEWIKPSK